MYGLLPPAQTHWANRLRTGAFAASVAAALLLIPAAAEAAEYRVTTFADEGEGSLRQAIINANQNEGHDTIILPPGTYTLTIDAGDEDPYGTDAAVGDLDILEGVTIVGADGDREGNPGETIIQAAVTRGSASSRVFDIFLDDRETPHVEVRFEALTIRHGAERTSGSGGGIQFWVESGPGKLFLYNTIVELNDAAASGGGISAGNNGQADALLSIEKSAIRDNAAGAFGSTGGSGGGIEVGYQLPVQVVESRLSGNTSRGGTLYTGQGGGLYLWDDAGSAPQSFIRSSVIDGNHASGSDLAGGGGLYIGRSLQIVNSTVSGNTADDYGGGIAVSVVDGHSVAMGNVTISGNTAKGAGGGLYLSTAAPRVPRSGS